MANPAPGSSSLVDLIESLPDLGAGWGPEVTTETLLNGVPYAPFSKGDKLGRMADWTADSKDGRDGRGGRQQYNRNYRDQQVYGAGSASLFAAPAAEDESTFSVVSNVRDTGKTRFGRGAVFTRGGRGQRGGARGDSRTGGRGQLGQRGGRGGGQYGGGGGYDGGRGGRSNAGARGGRRFGWKDYDKPARNRDASINIKADWKLLEEIDFNRLGKLNLEADEGEDIDSYGFLYYYDRNYDKPPVKSTERKLTALDRAAYNVTTSSDPVIQELADKDEATIFATDNILSMLMCSTRSVYPWDIVIVRHGNKVFLDKRDNAALDMVTVNENAADAPLDASEGSKDGINQPGALAEEATYINHNFSNQVVLENENQKVLMPHDNPFYNASEETEPPASKAYKYRRFDLSTSDEDPMYLIVRTELDAVQKNAISGEDQFVTVHALNEFDNKAQGSGGALDWRAKLVSQRGAVVATEMKNNSCKLARWTVQSILAKADVMKLGFVSRQSPKTNDKHVILGVVGWKPKDFANQMNLQLSNGWGIVRTIADMCLKREDGRYVLVKDPNKSILRLYEVPAGSFDEDADEAPEAEEEAEAAEDIADLASPAVRRHCTTKPKPNASILNYFTKAADETLFIGDGSSLKVEEEEDVIQDLEGEEQQREPELELRFNEAEGSVKRRKLSPGSRSNKEEKEVEIKPMAGRVAEPPPPKQQQQPKKGLRNNPFLDDSSEDEDEDEANDGNGSSSPATTSGPTETETKIKPDPEPQPTRPGRETLLRGVLLLRQETSVQLKQDESGNGEEFGELGDLEGQFEGEEDEEDFAGEEFRMMRYMQEQARLEAESSGGEADDTSMMESCPICSGSLAGANAAQATAHVNACLDGRPTPLPSTTPKTASLPSKGMKEEITEKVDVDVEVPEMGKRFANNKAAIARPGQAIPFTLGGAAASGGSGGGGGGSAFTKLMSNHAEDAAWATAAAAENASRGMPAYKRTCPFYKIMPGFSICVDAFRYGAVEGCKAYFLSHFHSDHYIGLTASWVHGPIYCSKVTASLVKTQLKTAAKYVVELDFDERVPVPGCDGVTVTMIPANHCPGSSLFLFEKTVGQGRVQRILHCGDFRACPAHIQHPNLKSETVDPSGKIRQQKIDVCYLDTTYLNPRYSFPPQDDVISACAELCATLNKGLVDGDDTSWDRLIRRREGGGGPPPESVSKFFTTPNKTPHSIEEVEVVEGNAFTALNGKSPKKNRLLVVCGTYSIGKERICKAIALALNTKIFASPAKIRICNQLGDAELSGLLTSDPREAQVHMQMLMEIRAETLAEYLEGYRGHFSKVVGFRPSGWNYRPTASKTSAGKGDTPGTVVAGLDSTGTIGSGRNVSANLPPSSVPSVNLLHGTGWRTRFGVRDMIPQRGSGKDALCFGVPYSEHSSFRELALFCMALRIEKIIPTVNVGSEQSRKRMKGWIDRWLAERRKGGFIQVLQETKEEDGGGGVVLWDGKDGKGGGVYW
ncbi:hypothetical protein QBC46DRAFT_293045 [Diplogelasinospora grovesii]|uniref:Eukaryotic translation initiation factor 3 subunit D n=1 Tax=Diplogelasinospora grovesii TaxID=303347 RepID=A0AAN6S2H5_9PEZI|nr:hypothetical protein QBC46DRAFT_293045 [Diplogelasinospora grovesii]